MARVRLVLILIAALIWPLAADAQQATTVQLATRRPARDTLSSNGDSITINNVLGMATARIQTLDTYSGTWEVQCSVDGVTFDADDEVNLVLDGQTATAQAVTDVVGIWKADISGCVAIKIVATAGFAASDTVVVVGMVETGGGGGSGSTVALTLQEADDASIASGQTADAVINLNQVFNGTAWVRDTVYLEDAAETAGGQLAMLGCVRRDTAASSAGTDGDNATCNVDATGHLWVLDTNSDAVLAAVQSAATSLDNIETSLAPESTHDNAVIATGAGILGEAKDIDGVALPNVVAEGDAVRIATVLNGAVLTVLVHEDGLTSPIVNEDVAETAANALLAMATVRRDTAASSAGTAGDWATLNTDGLGRLWVRDGDPCSDPARITSAAISESTAATNEIVALNGSDLIYVCSYKWVTTAANSLSWTYGTGADCVTSPTAIEGAQPYGANGGIGEVGGGHALFVVPAGKALCLVSSAATAHGGRISYVRTAAP